MRNLILMLVMAAGASAQSLRIFAIDADGGKATLYVPGSGESMLVDTGYDGFNGRDANRIAAAAKAAGVTRIDHLVITHFHGDHIGGLRQLAAKMPIGRIYDHGESVETGPKAPLFPPYVEARSKLPHTVVKAGDVIPVKGLLVQVVSADGKAIEKPLAAGGQANPLCSGFKPMEVDPGENAHSIALMITFGKMRIADLGDLYWNQEFDLACPANKLGTVDLYMTTHHGTKTSGSPQMVHALHPRVALMNNGATKGGSVEAWATVRESPGLIDLWQIHYSNVGGKEHNSPEPFLANPVEACKGEWLEVTAEKSGKFAIRNHRNGFEKKY